MNSKLFQVSIIILIGLALMALVTFFLWQMTSPTTVPAEQEVNVEQLSADEIAELSMDTEQITTNLYTQDFIIVQFNILVDNENAREEMEQKMPEFRAAIISLLSSKTPDDLQGEAGISSLEDILQKRFNEILEHGQVLRVLTIDRQIQ